MKFRVEFTLDVPTEDLPGLRELAGVDSNSEIRDFIIQDAGEYSAEYLGSNGVASKLVLPWERK